MDKITVYVRPFDMSQNIFVYKDNTLKEYRVMMEDLAFTISSLSNKYDISQIKLCGNIDYLLNIKNKIELDALKKFNKTNLNIELSD